ncbi:hypothetical protein V7O61_01675 [Methanolobus sp. WCC1]|uniref:hypothetical protein n=1 Tax=unclassified Methanolobus TaxID=2629569 RepID=UPI00324C1F55
MLSVISASAFLHSRTLENHENTTYNTSDGNTSKEQNPSNVSYEQGNITHQTSAVNTKIEQSTGIVSKVDVDAVSTKLPEDLDYNETVIIDTEKLNKSAKEGNINLTLMNKNIDIIIQSSGERKNGIGYKGFSQGNPDYSVDITIREKEVYASITTYDTGYNIMPTDVMVNGEIVHTIVAVDIMDTRLIEDKYPVDPLTFEINNEDTTEHEFSIEVYNPYGDLIFNESYSLNPGENIQSPEISEELGLHHYVYTLDNKDTFTLDVSVERSAGLSSSQKASFIFIDDPEHQMAISIEQA